MALILGAINFGSNFNIGAKGPIDSRMRVSTKQDLTSCWTPEIPAYKGMAVVCMEDSSIYVLVSDNATALENWKKVGNEGSVTATTYTEAKKVASAGNLGQIIYVTTEETVEGEDGTESTTYTAGPYIVTGEKEISKLGTTSASGDIQGDVNTLKGDVSTIKENIKTLQAKDTDFEKRVAALEADTVHTITGNDVEV